MMVCLFECEWHFSVRANIIQFVSELVLLCHVFWGCSCTSVYRPMNTLLVHIKWNAADWMSDHECVCICVCVWVRFIQRNRAQLLDAWQHTTLISLFLFSFFFWFGSFLFVRRSCMTSKRPTPINLFGCLVTPTVDINYIDLCCNIRKLMLWMSYICHNIT